MKATVATHAQQDQEQLFGSFKLFLRIINRCQPTQRTDCELLKKKKKSFFNIFREKK